MSAGDQVQDLLGHRREAADAQVAPTMTIAIWTLPSRLMRSLLTRLSSSLRPCSSSLTVFSSSLVRLQLLLGGVELLVGALQLLVARQDLLVGRLQLLVGGLELLDDRLQVLAAGRELRARSALQRARRRWPLALAGADSARLRRLGGRRGAQSNSTRKWPPAGGRRAGRPRGRRRPAGRSRLTLQPVLADGRPLLARRLERGAQAVAAALRAPSSGG